MRRKKLCAATLIFVLFELSLPGGRAGSDPSQPTGPEAAGVFGEATRYPQPDPVTGAMSYTVAFQLPEARGAAQPQLALTYNSSSADREAGYGWGLDLPGIERRALSGWPRYIDNGKAADEDRYVSSGQPLVFVCVVGAPGCATADAPMPPWANGWRSYRPQIEGAFARFFLSPDRGTWRIQRKGGEIVELGVPQIDPALSPAATEMGDGNKVFRWRIVRQMDVHGNLVVYVWKALGLRGLLYPTDIFDTPRASGTRSLDFFAHHTQLAWEAPGFAISRYAHIDRAQPDMRLARVAVSSMPWSGAAPRQVVRVYHLRYFAQRGPSSYDARNDAPLWHHSYLRSVQLEGECASVDAGGQIPPSTQCRMLPPISFEYQDGELKAKGGLFSSQTHNTPPGEDETNFKVLPFVESAALVDLNRDGLPDLVQSWPQGSFVDLTNFMDAFRRMPGYINTGDKQLLQLQWTHQCMDMGSGNPGDVAFYNMGKGAGFLTGGFGASVLGAWGDSLLLWSLVDYSQVTATPVEATPDFCSMAAVDPKHGAWKWVKGDEVGWSRHAESAPSSLSRNRWFADVDGDGLPDSFNRTAGAGGDLEAANVDFTRRFSKAERGGGQAAVVPFTANLAAVGNSLTPAEAPRSDTRFWYLDVNGDGLADLITYNPGDGGGIPRVRPGDGRGRFACDPSKEPAACFTPVPGAPAWVSDTYAIDVPDPKKPWPFTDDTYFHDVTGDGLADIIQYQPGNGSTRSVIRLWINQDGHTFRCATPANPDPCRVNMFFDDLHASFTIDPHRVTFADMDANGVDDMVLLGKSGAWASSVFSSSSASSPRAPRPGLLVKIDNGLGAVSLIDYKTIQELDLEATSNKEPWEFHSPQVVPVVARIRTLDAQSASGIGTTPEPYRIERTTNFTYRDPAYDLWSRSFLGFRKVRSKQGFDQSVTETTYWFGPCQRGVKQCPQSSDDEEWKARVGRPVRVDRFVPAIFRTQQAERLLSTTLYQYTNDTLFSNLPDRDVRYAYAQRVDTYLYDAGAPAVPGDTFPIVTNGDLLVEPARQAARVHLARTLQMDGNGNLVQETDEGRPDEASLNPGQDGRITRTAQVHCNAAWQCLTDNTTITSDPAAGPERKVRYTYDGLGKLKTAEANLTGTEPLERFHETPGAAVAPAPAAASTPGWKKLLSLDYDAFGNTVKIEGSGSPPTCTTMRYDLPYAQLMDATESHRAGCASPAITVWRVFDRGFGVVVSERSPNEGVTEIKLDSFGRPEAVNWPQPDGAPRAVVAALTLRYNDKSPLSWVGISRQTGTGPDLESVEVFNGLGERVFGFDRADPSAGDLGNWILRDWSERDSVGRLRFAYRPSFFTGDPVTIASAASPVAAPAAAGKIDYSYDDFGRPTFVTDGSVITSNWKYLPLVSDFYDAEQAKPTGPRRGQHTRLVLDGHGRPSSTISFIKGDQIRMEARYQATGEPWQITQAHQAGPETVSRTLTYDSLGRIVRNAEPNSTLSAGKFWRYAWDDAGRLVGTSDARGCGENLFYDGLGRIVAEDYSPCRKSQPAYTPPNLTTGDGTESFYRYDDYEPGQLEPVPGFADQAVLSIGRLASIQDLGSHTRFNYDNRGRLRRIARAIAPPGAPASVLQNRYTPHWYESKADYDLADRLTTRTTGVDVAELLAGGASSESYSYTARGFLRQIASAYGILLKEARFDADGAPREIVYGDAAATKATFGYDARRRLTQYAVSRAAPPIWGAATPTYPLPGPDTKQLQLMAYTFKYDDAGTLVQVLDGSPASSWPAGIKPANRDMAYDDLYRLTRVDYATGLDDQVSPFAAEEATSNRRAVPVRGSRRVRFQSFDYDWKGNTTASDDDRSLRYDRSLGPITNGEVLGKPNQLRSAGPGIRAEYDAAGNLTDLAVERTNCPGAPPSPCTHRFVYEWDEIGQLARAARWDYPGGPIPPAEPAFPQIPAGSPVWDLHNTYSMGDRVIKSAKNPLGDERHTLAIFGTLRVNDAKFRSGDYELKPETMAATVGGFGRLVYDTSLPSPAADPKHVFLEIGDQLGSTAAVIDLKTGELTERTGYQAYGAVESDYRPKRWNSFREDYKFTRKEEDMEAGLTYFGARYYQAHLGRWMSPDPLNVHGLGGDPNVYAYVGGRTLNRTDPIGLDGDQPPWAGNCTPDVQCLPPDEIKGPPKASPPPPPQPKDPAPSSPAPPDEPKGDTGPAKEPESTGDTLARLESRAEGIVAAVENKRFDALGKHFVIGNVHKETWNQAVSTLQWGSVVGGPLAIPGIIKLGDLKISVKSDPGDVSKFGPLIASLFIFRGSGITSPVKTLSQEIGGFAVGRNVRLAGGQYIVKVFGFGKIQGATWNLRAVVDLFMAEARALGASELKIIANNPSADGAAFLKAAKPLLERYGFQIFGLETQSPILIKALVP